MRSRGAANALLHHCRGKDEGLRCGMLQGNQTPSMKNVVKGLFDGARHRTSTFCQQAAKVGKPEVMNPLSVLIPLQISSFYVRFKLPSPVVTKATSIVNGWPVTFYLHKTFDRLSHGLRVLASRSFSLASEPAQDLMNINSSTSSCMNVDRTVKATARLTLKEYLCDAKGFTHEEAEFVSRNCPVFLSKLLDSLSTNGGPNGVGSEIFVQTFRSAIEIEDKKSVCEVTNEEKCRPPLGALAKLSAFPLQFTGREELQKIMNVVDSLGWTRSQIWETLERNPELLAWTVEELQTNFCILEKVGVQGKYLYSFIENPTVFTADLEGRLSPLITYLEGIGIGRDVLGDLLKFNPQGMIKMPVANFRDRVEYLVELGLSTAEVERCMRVFPQLLHLRLSNLSQKIEYFDSIGVDRKSMVKIIASVPSIFRHSIEKNLVPKVHMLENLGVSKYSLVKIVLQYPQYFGCSIQNLKQKLAFFQTNGLTNERLLKMLTWHPRALSFSVPENLMKKLEFLSSKGYPARSVSLGRALSSCITISTESLQARFENLQSVGFSAEEACELVRKQPTIFCLSEKTIRAKMAYLVNIMKRSPSEVLKCPGYLIYSLELRIKPRHRVFAMLADRGLLREGGYSLSTILQPAEKKILSRLAKLDPECLDLYLDAIARTDGDPSSNLDVSSLNLASEIHEENTTRFIPSNTVNFSRETLVAIN